MSKLGATLYKKDSTGAIRLWSITVQESKGYGLIITSHGLKDGQHQEDIEEIKEGKNIGKKNETSPITQAYAEMESRIKKKLKSGYVEDLDIAKSGGTDELIEGGILPMLATPLEKIKGGINYPLYIQPKLDGIRCIAIPDSEGNYTLWTRSRKPITSCPHIIEELNKLAIKKVLDGELYNHNLKDNFESIVSAVRKEDPSEESKQVQYHVYDVIESDLQFSKRVDLLKEIQPPHLVPTTWVKSEEDLEFTTKSFIEEGYEGSMLRIPKSKYENKRSKNLIKVKYFMDDEFEVVGVEEGKGRLAGHCGSVLCKTKEGNLFSAKMEGSIDALRETFENHKKDNSYYKGKFITVRYFSYTNKNKVPRFPVGVRFRDDLDF